MAEKIVVTVKEDVAIVRKVVLDGRGMMVEKYGLSSSGEWIKVAEGEGYPDECLLRVGLEALRL